MIKATTIRIEETECQRYADIYGTTSGGVTFAALGFLALRRHEIKRLRGIFTRSELALIIDIFDGLVLMPEIMPSLDHFMAHLDDECRYNNLPDKYGVSFDPFMTKIKSLSPASVFFLQDAIKEMLFHGSGSESFINEMAL